MSRYLLDANALIALGWPAHEHHRKIQAWFKDHARHGWASAPFAQAGFVRVVSQPAFSGNLIGPREAAELLSRNLTHRHHSFFRTTCRSPRSPGCVPVVWSVTGK